METELNQAARQKRLKAGTACTNCRRKKLRCTGTPSCARCVAHNLECVVDEALFLKTNSPQSLYAKTGGMPSSHGMMGSSSNASSSHRNHHHNNNNNNNNNSGNSNHYNNNQQYRSKSNNHHHGSYHNDGHMSSSSDMDDFMDRRTSAEFQSDRRMSGSSVTSYSSMSPSPSPANNSYNYNNGNQDDNSSNSFNTNAGKLSQSTYRPGSGHRHPSSSSTSSSHHHSNNNGYMSQSSSGNTLNKKRSSREQGTTKPKQKRRDSHSHRDSDPPSPQLTPQDSTSSSSSSSGTNKNGGTNGEDFKSVVSTMSLDGHGQHFHGSSSGFYVCQLSSRYRQGVYPLPMAHLNDSDLWSHSLQITSERELPSREEMDVLLGLYFRYMYPFAPMFIRRIFMEQHQKRPDLSQILILNAIFCNACWYSDDPVIRQDSTKYFNRAKIILDETYHVSRISTVQALLLMSHHQYAVGNYSGGWLYTGMATRIAHDIGLHRQDFQVNEPAEAEIRKRVWWAVYIADRLGGGVLGRPLNLRDKEYNVEMPSDDWINEIGGDDEVEYPYEPERIVSCRLLWAVKLFMQMGNVLNTMHCIEAEINGAFLADISRTQLPQLHNSLTSWFLSLPNELMYTPYTMSPNSNHPPSPPTALMHMFYYTTLTMLHRPYLRPVNSAAIDSNFLVSSRNICTAAATNVCHIADSLMLHGQLRDTCYYGMACLLAAGTVHVHNAITPTPSNRETTRAGLSKTVKAAHELVKTFPVAESLIAVALDVFASQTTSAPTEMAASFIDISTFVAPFLDMTQLQNSTIGNIYEAARLAKVAKDGPGPAPSIQLRHPYGNFSMPLPEQGKDQSATNLSTMWQSQIATAVAMAAIAFGGTDPHQEEQQFFANPLELPESLRLAPIDAMMFGVDGTGTSGLDSFGVDSLVQLGGLDNSAATTGTVTTNAATAVGATTATTTAASVAAAIGGFDIPTHNAESHLLQYQHMQPQLTFQQQQQQQQQLLLQQQQQLQQQQAQQTQQTQQVQQAQQQTQQNQQFQQQLQQQFQQHLQQSSQQQQAPAKSSIPAVTQPTAQIASQPQQQQATSTSGLFSQAGNSSTFSTAQALNFMQAALASSLQVRSPTPLQQDLQQHQQATPTPNAVTPTSVPIAAPMSVSPQMEDDTADPPSPPAIFSSDDMDMEAASLTDDTPSPTHTHVVLQASTSTSMTMVSPSIGDNGSHGVNSSNNNDSIDLDKSLAFFNEALMQQAANQQQQQLQKDGQKELEHQDVNSLLFNNHVLNC
ncbi:hypothetical protein FBU30_004781 [Linnemannia zychae]|nr:hypothetical protein FBU30_004781 [Linnemannia zychae]